MSKSADFDDLYKQSLEAVAGDGKSAPDAALPAKKRVTIRATGEDQLLINKIIDMLYEQTGERVQVTVAIRIALILCPLNPAKLVKAFEAAKASDERRK